MLSPVCRPIVLVCLRMAKIAWEEQGWIRDTHKRSFFWIKRISVVILGIMVTLACGLGAGVSGVICSVKDLFARDTVQMDSSYFWIFQSIYNFISKKKKDTK